MGDAAEDINTDFLDMSDEEFSALDSSVLDSLPEEEAQEEENAPEEALASEGADETELDNNLEEDTESVEEPEAEETEDQEENETEELAASDAEPITDQKEEQEKESEVDYKALYQKILAPFKANGKEMTVSNVEDAIQLMQMGADYNRKMAGLKPNRALLKMLEKNDLLSEEKLSFLIDIDKKDPAAIAKLLKDNKIDPLELNLDEGDSYKTADYSVDTRELDLDEVIDGMKNTSTFQNTINVVDKWDADSKQAVANAPQLLQAINQQMGNGIYDLISTTVESERVFGRLQGLSDIQAYQTVGDALQAKGGFNHLFEQVKSEPTTPRAETEQGNDENRKDKRRAASPTKKTASKKKPSKEYDPLAMSDEEFMKHGDSKFL